jgi:hypothetical protein
MRLRMIKRIIAIIAAGILAGTIARAECPVVEDEIKLNEAGKNLYMDMYKMTDEWRPLTAAGEG